MATPRPPPKGHSNHAFTFIPLHGHTPSPKKGLSNHAFTRPSAWPTRRYATFFERMEVGFGAEEGKLFFL